jgi:large conductance mechanosensitive channel
VAGASSSCAIGTPLEAIARSLVGDVPMPPLGLIPGCVDFGDLFVILNAGATAGPDETLAAAKKAGAVTLDDGLSRTPFLVVSFAVFHLVRPYEESVTAG